MHSSNNGTNRILPMETIESGISCKAKMRNTMMTAVNPNCPLDSFESSHLEQVRDKNNFAFQPFEVEMEIQAHTEQSEVRRNIYQNIVCNISTHRRSKKTCIYFVLIIFMGICGSLLSTSVYTMIPVHDIIQNQHYWYEFPSQLLFGLLPNWVAMIIFRCKYYMNINKMKWIHIGLIMWLSAGIVTFIYFAGAYYFWSVFLGLHYPMPMMGYMYAFIMMVTLYTSLWNQFPAEWRQNDIFRRRLVSFFVALLLNQACVFEYAIITKLFILIPENYQWIAALFLPIIREINISIGLKWAKKASGQGSGIRIILCYFCITKIYILTTLQTKSVLNSCKSSQFTLRALTVVFLTV